MRQVLPNLAMAQLLAVEDGREPGAIRAGRPPERQVSEGWLPRRRHAVERSAEERLTVILCQKIVASGVERGGDVRPEIRHAQQRRSGGDAPVPAVLRRHLPG